MQVCMILLTEGVHASCARGSWPTSTLVCICTFWEVVALYCLVAAKGEGREIVKAVPCVVAASLRNLLGVGRMIQSIPRYLIPCLSAILGHLAVWNGQIRK